MRGATASLCLVAAAGLLVDGTAQACGDKPLVIARAVRSQRVHGAVHRASILVFLGAREDLRGALRDMGLRQELLLSGHVVRVASSRDELVTEIRSGSHDILLADLREVGFLDPELLSEPGSPFLLPVVVNPTGDEWAEAASRFSCIRQSPAAEMDYLAVIEDVVAERRSREREGQ